MTGNFNLDRFLEAQNPVYEQVVAELRRGLKASHWMWFIFPQIQGLGSSPTAVKFSIKSREEAKAYLQHSVLGPRLIECTQLVLEVDGSSADEIFGYPDNLKFHSSMTLFAAVSEGSNSPEQSLFDRALQKCFSGRKDRATLERLGDDVQTLPEQERPH